MRLRFATLAATLSVIGLIVWLAQGRPASPVPESKAAAGNPGAAEESTALREPTGGSAVPCAVPLAWRIVRVDEDFGMEVVAAERALAEAMTAWEDAAGRPLFVIDGDAAFPVRFVYDERQESTEERRRMEAAMASERRQLEERQAVLERAARDEAEAAASYDRRGRELERRVDEHNQRVRLWNERGGAPTDTLAAVEAAGEALERERGELREMERRIEAERARLQEESALLEEMAESHNARLEELGRRFPGVEVESGVYREAALVEGGTPTTVQREIRVYRFDDSSDLVRVLAHELGHSLGLGHAAGPGALMSESYGRTTRPPDEPLVRPEDVRSLREKCPGVVGG